LGIPSSSITSGISARTIQEMEGLGNDSIKDSGQVVTNSVVLGNRKSGRMRRANLWRKDYV